MAKTIIRETAIILLLLVVITLIFGILFYDYIPTSKIAPAKVQPYTPTEEVKNEIQDTLEKGQNIVKTYSVDSSYLNIYESTKDYDKGKVNPFASSNTTSTTTSSSNTVANKNNTTTNNIIVNNKTTNQTVQTPIDNTSKNFFNNTGKNQ